MPEAGGVVRVSVPEGRGGRQVLVGETISETYAPEGSFVTVEYQDIRLKAKMVRADYGKKTITAEGTVVLEQGLSRLTGDRVDLDLNEKIGVITNGSVDLPGGLHLKGALLSKVGPRTFNITDGLLTACEGEKPAWSFKVSSGRVTLEDYARLKNVVFRFGGVPLLYTPYLLWPAKQDRASGFLIPGVGYSRNRGAFLGLSYYAVLGRSWDATLSADLYSKQYLGLGLELRARPSEGTRLEGVGYTTYDRDLRTFEWQTRGSLLADDLGPGLRGVAAWRADSNHAFFQSYNRDFDYNSARALRSEAFVTKTLGALSANLRVSNEEALYGETTVTSQRLPELDLRMRPTAVLGQRVFVEAEGRAGFLSIDKQGTGPEGKYARFDLFPRVSAPLSPFPWLSLRADAGYRITGYGKSLEKDIFIPPGPDTLTGGSYMRSYFQGGLELTGPSFAKLFDMKLGSYTKLKHVIEPRFDYDYIPDITDQARTPSFDEVDFASPTHTVRYALVQRLLGKAGKGAAREIASLELAGRYRFELPTALQSSPNATKTEPFDATLRINAGSGLSVDARATYDAKNSKITSTSLNTSITAGETAVALSLFDSRPVSGQGSAQLRVTGGVPIIPKLLRFDVQASYDLTRGRALETRSLLTVQGSCWKILAEVRDLRLTATPQRDYRIALTLKNVGSFLDITGNFPR